MGWLFRNAPLRHEAAVSYICRQLTYETQTLKNTVLDAIAVRGVTYAAVRTEDKSAGTIYTLCAVVPFKNSRRNGFGFRIMNETMGPYEADCPDRIMRLLSPVPDIPDSASAGKWRERVRKCKAASEVACQRTRDLQPGTALRLEREICI
jgi:hypothetical protein